MLLAVVREAWPIWLAVGGIAGAAVIASALSSDTTTWIRYTSVGLEVLGICTVAYGLSDVRRAFGRPSLGQKLVGWARRLWSVIRLPPPTTAVFKGSGGLTLGGSARVRFGASADSPIEHRLTVLEQNVARLQDEVDANETALRRDLGLVKESLGTEQQVREGQFRQLATQLEEFAVGGLHLEFVGLVWLVAGGLGTNIPEEIATWLTRFTRAVS